VFDADVEDDRDAFEADAVHAAAKNNMAPHAAIHTNQGHRKNAPLDTEQ
jgi:hypothetical protein